jgi:hypothetical protein
MVKHRIIEGMTESEAFYQYDESTHINDSIIDSMENVFEQQEALQLAIQIEKI